MEQFRNDKDTWHKARIRFAGFPYGGPRLTVHAGSLMVRSRLRR